MQLIKLKSFYSDDPIEPHKECPNLANMKPIIFKKGIQKFHYYFDNGFMYDEYKFDGFKLVIYPDKIKVNDTKIERPHNRFQCINNNIAVFKVNDKYYLSMDGIYMSNSKFYQIYPIIKLLISEYGLDTCNWYMTNEFMINTIPMVTFIVDINTHKVQKLKAFFNCICCKMLDEIPNCNCANNLKITFNTQGNENHIYHYSCNCKPRIYYSPRFRQYIKFDINKGITNKICAEYKFIKWIKHNGEQCTLEYNRKKNKYYIKRISTTTS